MQETRVVEVSGTPRLSPPTGGDGVDEFAHHAHLSVDGSRRSHEKKYRKTSEAQTRRSDVPSPARRTPGEGRGMDSLRVHETSRTVPPPLSLEEVPLKRATDFTVMWVSDTHLLRVYR